MSICPKCNGYGTIGKSVPDILHGKGAVFTDCECDVCHGSGEVHMTNFDWLTESPERLAGWIENVLIESGCEATQFREMWVEWLKQPHSFE